MLQASHFRPSVPLALAAFAVVVLPGAPARAAVDLTGTWFVLIHYTDSATANPDADRWEDKVWKIEKKGSRLQWTEYPIVVFDDGSGRFGRVGGNARARLLRKWEPNEGQMREILEGPRVNSRGSKTKTLRGSPKRGYASTSRSRSVSAMTVGYEETWTIEKPAELPVFVRDDALGAESALATGSDDVVSGRTRYATLEISEDGNLLTGEYARDDNKRGSFKLIRAGDVRGLESDGRTPNEKAQENFVEQLQEGIRSAGYAEFLRQLGDANTRRLRARIGEDGLTEIYTKYEQRLLAGDPSAPSEVADALREAYVTALIEDLRKKGLDGESLLAGADGAGIPPEDRELLRELRETLGSEKLASLRRDYGERLAAGDEQALEAVRREIRRAYEEKLRKEFSDRLNAGDPEAMRQLRELQRQERDRR